MDNNNPQNSELAELEFKANKTTDDSLESTRRMLQLCDESKEAGFRTLMGLDEQGEQLDKVEEDMDKINVDMREAEKNLTGMEKCCGICILPCAKRNKFKEDAETWKASDDGKVVNGQPTRVVDNRAGTGITTTSYVAKITNDAREDEMEENLTAVGNMVSNLRNMAKDMGDEVSNQNSQLERIRIKTEANDTRIKQANQRATQLLK